MTTPTTNRSGPLARNQYREGQILRASDLLRESEYFLARDRQHNALAHGPGILQGLTLVATETGSETPVTEQMLIDDGPRPIDLAVEAGVGIDWIGRLLIVPRKAPVGLQLATRPSPHDEGTYSLGLYFKRPAPPEDQHDKDPCQGLTRNQLLEESYELRLARFDPTVPEQPFDPGDVYDGPTDDSGFPRPLILGLVEWDGKAYVGYSTAVRRYAPVRAHIVRAPNDRAELELRDENEQFAVRFAKMPPKGDPNPFKPGAMEDRLTLDEEGKLWVRSDASVGPTGIGFRTSHDSTTPSTWRAHLEIPKSGAAFGVNDANPPVPLQPDEYAPGTRELRVVFQRESGAGAGTGRHRAVIGLEDSKGFEPAVVVYDHPPVESDKGFAVVEICGDLYVRGTTFVQGVSRMPMQKGSEDDLSFLLRQLAGPLAGTFRAFLTTDPTWLKEFATIMAKQTTFIDDVMAKLKDPKVLEAVLAEVVKTLDDPTGEPMPTNLAAQLVAALYHALLKDPVRRKEIIKSVPASDQSKVTDALDWLVP